MLKPKNHTRCRRLRKKLHLGEFAEYGLELTLRFTHSPSLVDPALTNWIRWLETQDWQFGGGLSGLNLSGFLCRHRGNLDANDRQRLLDWLGAQSAWQLVALSDFIDSWYPDA